MISNTPSSAAPRVNKTKQKKLVGLMLALAVIASHETLRADGPAPVNLGSTAHFTILAGAAITTTGGGVIHGDVGASPITGAAIHLTQAQVKGIIYSVDAAGPPGSVIAPALLSAAMGDLTTAYNDAAGRMPTPTGTFLNPGVGNLAGLTLSPGLYKFTGTASIAGGDVTLSGGPDDVWIFQIASDLEVASMVHVVLAGGAQTRNIFWQVGTSATIGTFSVFKGTILANQAITMNSTSAMDGRALAFSAGVTFNGDVDGIPTSSAPTFISITKTNTSSVNLLLSTTPYYLLSLQSTPSLFAPTWVTIATATPTNSTYFFTDTNIMATTPVNFYRAFVTTP